LETGTLCSDWIGTVGDRIPLEEPEEAGFPLITIVDGKRYELYSDGTFDEVEK
jgi:hypothetical protein